MFELPELATIADQMNLVLTGRTVSEGRLGNSPHKFVWYNREHDEFARIVRGKRLGKVRAEAKWLFLPLDPGYVLLLGEWGGRILYREPSGREPGKYHLYLRFDDGSALSATTQMWGGVGLFEKGHEREWPYVRDVRMQPIDPAFTRDYFRYLLAETGHGGKRTVKGVLTQEGIVPGVGNALAQDIMFRARLHPRRRVARLGDDEIDRLHDELVATVRDALQAGGRSDERDLFGRPGGYVRLMDAKAVGKPCPRCGTAIQRFAYLGGTCYACPHCQK